jgi:hypothetical protein
MAISEVVSNAATPSQASPVVGGVQTKSKGTIRFCEIVIEQGRALEESCERQALRDTLVAARWHRWNLLLGITSVVLSTLVAYAVGHNELILKLIQYVHEPSSAGAATAGAFAVDPAAKAEAAQHAEDAADALKAFLSLLSAGLVSVLTFLVPSEKAGDYHHFSNKLRALRDKIRCFVDIDCVRPNRDVALVDRYERLVDAKAEIDASHPIVPRWVYAKSYSHYKQKLILKQSLREHMAASGAQRTPASEPILHSGGREPAQSVYSQKPTSAN